MRSRIGYREKQPIHVECPSLGLAQTRTAHFTKSQTMHRCTTTSYGVGLLLIAAARMSPMQLSHRHVLGASLDFEALPRGSRPLDESTVGLVDGVYGVKIVSKNPFNSISPVFSSSSASAREANSTVARDRNRGRPAGGDPLEDPLNVRIEFTRPINTTEADVYTAKGARIKNLNLTQRTRRIPCTT